MRARMLPLLVVSQFLGLSLIGCGSQEGSPLNNPVPSITALSPSTATAAGAAFTLTVSGTNFISTSVVHWNGSDRSTNFVSSTQLTAPISANDVANAASASVTVFNPAPGGGTSGAKTFTIIPQNNPLPQIAALSPSTATAGGAALTLTVSGTGFISASVVRWNGSDRPTAFQNSTQVTAQIPASDIATVAAASVTVFNPTPGGGTSNQLTFAIDAAPASPRVYVTVTNIPPGSGTISVIDTDSNTVVAPIAVGLFPHAVGFTPDNTRAYVTNFNSSDVSVIATSTSSVVATVGVGRAPYGVAVTPDGTRVYVSNWADGTTSVIDTISNTVVATILVGTGPSCVAFTNDGARTYMINSSLDYGSVSVIDTATSTVLATIVTNSPSCVALSPDGARAYVTSAANDVVSVIDTKTNTVVASVGSDDSPGGLAFTPDGTRVYVANYNTNDVSVIDTSSNTVVARIAVGISPSGVAVTSDGTRVYVTNGGSHNDGSVSVIDTTTNTVLATINVGGFPCCEMGIAIQRNP